MSIAITHGRWLGLFLALACLATTAQAQRNVTLRLNTATLPDTTMATSLIEVRGCLEGCTDDMSALPNNQVIAWNDQTTLEPENIGGDYWQVSFQIPDNQKLEFKFFSQQAEEEAQIGGWEDGANHAIEAGTGDVDLGLHFFEKGPDEPYDWLPFEEKEDSIAVWFRVYMLSEDGVNKGYNSTAGQTIGVRGDDLSGESPLDWGNTKVILERESDTQAAPGYDLYSGVGYYPMSAAGRDQQYKFVFHAQGGVLSEPPSGWEDLVEGGNRSFTVPAQDTTLSWRTFGNTKAAGAQPVQSAVIFAVDLTPMREIGVFDPARGDTLEVRGDFNGWDCTGVGAPDDCLLLQVPGAPEFEQVISITSIPGAVRNYKFFLNLNDAAFRAEFGVDPPSGWEEPISTTGANRQFVFEGIQNGFQDLGIRRFNDVLEGNILPDGVSVDVNFTVDMSEALNNADPFVPGADSVLLQIDDPIWAFTQGGTAGVLRTFELTDDDGDMVYTGTLTVNGPTYGVLQYRYTYGGGARGNTYFAEEGGGFNDLGRRRTRFIAPNPDGSWPAEWDVVAEAYQPTGILPFDPNPVATGIEVVDSEVPKRIALGQNYPNPFNPSTTFEYTLDRTQHVKIRVYDLLGRAVATLADGVQPAATYKVTFDAGDLASGVYLYQIETPTTVISKRMVLIK